MLDTRLKTFLTLSQVLNYTKTAEILFISQPAVSQHIKYLENKYDTKLFIYKDKKLSLTKKGEILYNFLISVSSKSKDIEQILLDKTIKKQSLKFGTTLTIGEYLMPNILKEILKVDNDLNISLTVDNTETLLHKLKNGHIEFALLEGHFNKSKFESILFSKEEFIGICSNENELSKKVLNFNDIFSERLLIREKGSGSREIFEHILYEHNYKMSSFKNKLEIANINTIKSLVSNNLGITFLYKRAVEKELKYKTLNIIKLSDFSVIREFNFVFLKDNLNESEIIEWFDIFYKAKKKGESF